VSPVAPNADGYVAVAPRIFQSGQPATVSLALFRGIQPATDVVTASLLQQGQTVASTSGQIAGRGALQLVVPSLATGDYELQVAASGFQDKTTIQVEDGTLYFLESDKPIYQPGQTIHLRLLALDSGLKPVPGQATIEISDATGTKVFRKTLPVDAFGMATLDLPLSTEPNLGVWKARASSGSHLSELDVRVERYVLPKFEVKLDLPRDWALVGDPIKGSVAARYNFGKPVNGDVEIHASRYVGTWQEYARVSTSIGGTASFEIPPVRYAAGVPTAGGLGQIRLDVTVREQATGYEETTSQLVSIASSPVNLQLIPESSIIKPGLPFTVLAIAQTPEKKPVDADVQFQLNYFDDASRQLQQASATVATQNGIATLQLTPPANATGVGIAAWTAASLPQRQQLVLRAGYSPSGSYVHVQPVSAGALKVGDVARFKVLATREARSFYYEVLARGSVVFSDFTPSAEIAITLTPGMAPEARLLVYQILSNAEVAADYLPFSVQGDYPHQVQVDPGQPEAKPGDQIAVSVRTEGPARVGLVAVDKSVFILAENRLNLQQVFAELERLFLTPRAELHDVQPLPLGGPAIQPGIGPGGQPLGPARMMGSPVAPVALGAQETFAEAGVVVLTNRQVPAAPPRPTPVPMLVPAPAPAFLSRSAAPAAPAAAGAAVDTASAAVATPAALAEVQRVRQFFPETWLWTDLTTDATGHATQKVDVPDSITTWMLRAVALSKDKGLGVAEAELRAFQPFFVQVDLPYAALRGEEFPAKVALYNYQSTPQDFVVDLAPGDWFDLVDVRSKRVSVGPNSVGATQFAIRPTGLGSRSLDVTARSQLAADSLVKSLRIEPEGIAREVVENAVLVAGAPRPFALAVPADAVSGSARRYLALTGNALTQTVDGLDQLLQMPFGCGEQNMILFAPDVSIARYLKDTNQLKPEVMAKAETLMLTGYQRELTFRRSDGSFSAFGENDPQGSLFLTAFVLRTFAQARDLIFVDDGVLASAGAWIRQRQNPDGSFDPFGFLHHQDLLGGLSGKTALTALVGIALHEAGESATVANAVAYVNGKLGETSDAYGLATTAYLLALTKSDRAQEAHDRLMTLAHESADGLFWGDQAVVPLETPLPLAPAGAPLAPALPPRPFPHPSAVIETTGYATLALLQVNDPLNANKAIRWLAAQRNANGGFGSTQDTVVALQAMTEAARTSRSDVDATVTLRAPSGWQKQLRVTADNADVLQIVDLPDGDQITAELVGKGQVLAQSVRRFNVPAADDPAQSVFQLDVRYSADQVAINDLVDVTATVRFAPPDPVAAGMVVLDVAVPTGFAPVEESIRAAVAKDPRLKRWDVAGRKVIFYVQDLRPGEQLALTFQVRALHPVKALPASSQAYSYYRPEWRGESLGAPISVG
jgi:CD109 antigen